MILIKCDFCFGPDPVWDYPAQSFRLNEAAGGLSGVSPSRWGACATCHDLIEADDWAKVEARADHGLDRAYGYPAGGRAPIERRVRRDLARFRTHRTGPPAARTKQDAPLPTWSFTLILTGLELHDDVLNALFEAGCDDGTFGESAGVSFAGFQREAANLQTAIISATRAVESVSPLHVVRVELDEEDLIALIHVLQ